ncbi:uncharacterized protein LOC123321720 [Coccinella septempunctata]|uniref:uncharacterized protein LOC123321720 n=1 Tax=Coccinella septempunctata TaxID=41139 RepID=UPI001D095570|nr:uncharacterized protein LOC123321720 [Coccinella septempunctata]
MNDEVVVYCQTQIIESGLVLDEDLIFIQMVERKVVKPATGITRGIILLATAAGTTFLAMKKGSKIKAISAGVILILPAASSLFTSVRQKRKSENQKKWILELLNEFKNLSRIHLEVTDFFKCFTCSIESSSNPYMKISEDTIYDLSKSSCDVQVLITNEMLKVISEIHVGLQDVTLDLTEFEKTTAAPLVHDTILGCLRNANFVEGQVVLLRSHLLTSMFLVSSSKGNRAVFSKVLNKIVPSLVILLKNSINEIKLSLDKTRFPNNPPSLSLTKIENIFAQKKLVSVPRMRRHIIKINDGICCTLMKLRVLLDTLENVEGESQMFFLQEAISTLTQELQKCYMSSADLEKLIALLNRNLTYTKLDPKTILEVPKNDLDSSTLTSERVVTEMEELIDDSDYQVFANEISDDDNEGHAVRFYKRFMNNDVDWLAELKQSDEFQRRQTKFHTGLPVTSTPVEPSYGSQDGRELFKTALSHEASSSSGMQLRTPPPPPPLPAAFSDISEITVGISTLSKTPESSSWKESSASSVLYAPETQPLKPLTTVESSLLVDSLKGVLDNMGRRDEEYFE